MLTTQGEALAAQGVWVPGRAPRIARKSGPDARPLLLEARGLGVARVRDRLIRSELSVAVAAGETLALTGPNGSGKSTLALTLAGLLPPAAGEVVASEELAAGAGPHPIRWRSRELLTRIGTVFQTPEHQFLATTVRDELAIGPRALALPEAEVARAGRAAARRARPRGARGGEPVHAVGRSAAPALGRDGARDPAARARARRADLRAGLRHLGARSSRCIDETRAQGAGLVLATHDHAVIDALAATEFELGAVAR